MRNILFVLLCLLMPYVYGQEVALGQWRTHLPYNNVYSLAVTNQKVFCASTGGLFTYDLSSKQLETLSTIDGLSDINVQLIAFDNDTKQLLVAYKNSKIDLITESKIYHLTDIYDKNNLGDKTINAITFNNGFAYISCSFGIVVYNILKREVKDTYYLNNGSLNFSVKQTVIINDVIFANTTDGILQSNLNNPLLADVNTWEKHGATKNYPASQASCIVGFNNQVYGLFDDGIYRYNSTWELTQIFRPNVHSLQVSNNQLLAIADFRLISYNQQEQIIQNIQNTQTFNQLKAAAVTNDNVIFLADEQKGLIATNNGSQFNFLLPNGPSFSSVQQLNYENGKMYLAAGGISDVFAPTYSSSGFAVFNNNQWQSFNATNSPSLSNLRDVVATTYNASESATYLASYVNGLLSLDNKGEVEIYNQNNSTLQLTVSDPNNIRVNGLDFDSEQNLWVSQYGVNKPLSVKRNNGSWQSFDFSSVLPNPITSVTGLLVDVSDNKWLKLRNEGLLIFNGATTKRIAFGTNNGGLPGSNVNSLAIDKDGAVWIGTNQGVAVAYHPEDLLLGQDVEIPNLMDGKFLRPLLVDQNINCIAVDGANRKWFGTDNGVWLFNESGSKQLKYFNTSNSPLLNNIVVSIAVDDKNGEVFFGTRSGVISYKSDATAPVFKMEKVIIYPNPVRPGFSGTIGIKGLSENANVKITDINGVLVYETKANGGQATWNGKNFSGEAASSGVYLVLVVSKDGADTAVGKILIVR